MLRPGTDLQGEFGRMTRAGVESVVTELNWAAAQPAKAAAPDFARSDGIVLAAARRGMRVLPVVVFAPAWAAVDPSQVASPPRNAPYAAFLRAAIARYGPRGSLWTEHPAVRRVPIRSWQVWNEPSHEGFWTIQPFAARYVSLLRAAHRAIKGADPGARVVLAGLVYDSWTQLQRLYAKGAHGWFDVLSLHPYTRKLSDVLVALRRNRRVLDRHRDRDIPIIATELSWPSAVGHTDSRYGYEVTEREQARRVAAALPRLAAARRTLRLESVTWFSWLSDDVSPHYPFDYAGLRTTGGGTPRDKPALAAYRTAALRLEGCGRKGATIARCG
ncbi:MAG: endo,4-beta-xylanase [Solirubrobacterales bacterium]|nr:endo,4-beta-xylanase [Solirubrobacterales bacterium]